MRGLKGGGKTYTYVPGHRKLETLPGTDTHTGGHTCGPPGHTYICKHPLVHM